MATTISLIGPLAALTPVVDKQAVVQDPINGVFRRRIKFAELMAMLPAQIPGWTTWAAADKIAIIPIPKGSIVQNVTLCVLSPDGNTTCTISIGDSGTVGKYSATSDLKAAAGTVVNFAVTGTYNADDAIYVGTLLTIANWPTNAVIEIAAQVITMFPALKANSPLF